MDENKAYSKAINPARLKSLRKKLKMTQSELGALINRDAQTIRAWERGTYQVPDPIDWLIAEKLSAPYEYLIGEDVPDNLTDYEDMLVQAGHKGFDDDSKDADIMRCFFTMYLNCNMNFTPDTQDNEVNFVSLIFEDDISGKEYKIPESLLYTTFERMTDELFLACYKYEHSAKKQEEEP